MSSAQIAKGFDYAAWLRGLPDWLDANRDEGGGLVLSKKVTGQMVEIVRALSLKSLLADHGLDLSVTCETGKLTIIYNPGEVEISVQADNGVVLSGKDVE